MTDSLQHGDRISFRIGNHDVELRRLDSSPASEPYPGVGSRSGAFQVFLDGKPALESNGSAIVVPDEGMPESLRANALALLDVKVPGWRR